MLGQRLLAETLPVLFEAAPPLLGLRALGMVWTEAAGDIFVTCAMPNGVSSLRVRTRNEIVDALVRLTETSGGKNAPAGCALSVPIPNDEDIALLLFSDADISRPGAEQAAGLQVITNQAATALTSKEPPDSEIARLRREVAVDRLLPDCYMRPMRATLSKQCPAPRHVMPVSEVLLELAGGHGGESMRCIARLGEAVAVESQAASALPWSLELGGLTYQLVQADAQRRSSVRVPFASTALSSAL